MKLLKAKAKVKNKIKVEIDSIQYINNTLGKINHAKKTFKMVAKL